MSDEYVPTYQRWRMRDSAGWHEIYWLDRDEVVGAFPPYVSLLALADLVTAHNLAIAHAEEDLY